MDMLVRPKVIDLDIRWRDEMTNENKKPIDSHIQAGGKADCWTVKMTAYILNFIDLVFTLYALRHGAIELNPLMKCVPIMITYKVFIVGAFLWWLSKRKEQVAWFGLNLSAAVFAVVDVWHILNLIIIPIIYI